MKNVKLNVQEVQKGFNFFVTDKPFNNKITEVFIFLVKVIISRKILLQNVNVNYSEKEVPGKKKVLVINKNEKDLGLKIFFEKVKLKKYSKYF